MGIRAFQPQKRLPPKPRLEHMTVRLEVRHSTSWAVQARTVHILLTEIYFHFTYTCITYEETAILRHCYTSNYRWYYDYLYTITVVQTFMSVEIALEMTNKHRVMDNSATSSTVRLVQWWTLWPLTKGLRVRCRVVMWDDLRSPGQTSGFFSALLHLPTVRPQKRPHMRQRQRSLTGCYRVALKWEHRVKPTNVKTPERW